MSKEQSQKQSPRVILITGGSRGIGLAMVKAFIEAGDQVVTCARSDLSSNPAHLKLPCDVTKQDDVNKVVQETLHHYGRIDVLINNAGLTGSNSMDPNAPASESDDLWHQIMDVNMNGTYYFSKKANPHIPEGGRIINVASILALKGVQDATAYCAAKHAVLGFTRALSHQLASRKITVNAICPGWTRTEMAWGRMNEMKWSEQDLNASVPLGRFVEPEEIAALALYLAGPGASALTGQSITMDGGVLA